MWTKAVDRAELIDILQGAGHIECAQVEEPALLADAAKRSQDIHVVWDERPSERPQMPSMILVQPDRRRDFVAWAWTYLPAFRPITANLRIVDATDVELVLRHRGRPMLGKLEDACLGLILGEVATHMDEWTNLTRVPPSACARTFSFAMARALSLHGVRRDGSPVSGAWFRARELTRQPKLRIAEAHMRAPWSAVLSLWADEMPTGEPSAQVAPNLVLDACRDLFSAGAISEPTWKTLVSSLSEMADIRARMGATREERVIHLERAIDVLRRSSLEPETGAFFCGYLTSLVAEGTVEHGGILYPHIQAFPSSLMWYGLCAGLSVRPRLKGHLGGFGRRVLRDLLRLESPLDSPTCDIALTELEVLMGAGASVVDLRTAVQGYMLVELAPCVTTALRWPPGDAVQGELLSTAPDDGLRDLLGELHITMGNVISTYRKLSRLVGDDGARYGREQRDRKQRRKRK